MKMTVSDGEEFYDEASDSGSDFQDSGDESDDFEPQPKKKVLYRSRRLI